MRSDSVDSKLLGANTSGSWFNSLKQSEVAFTIYTALSAFALYTCVYAFRKTFAAATFSGSSFWGIDYKVLLVIAQVCGYAISKFFGIKLIAELKANGRAKGILLMTGIAACSWLFFAIVPSPFNIVFLVFNGLSLGLVWGMVFGYLEGRKVTEALGAALSISFIFSSGLCRSVGAYLLKDWQVSEYWMPFVASCIFIAPLLLFLFLLNRTPPPSAEDVLLRTKREPMTAADRKRFITTFLPGIILFVIAYMFLTAYRDFRDNFSAEVWTSLGYGDKPEIYTTTEVPVSLAVLIIIGSVMLIRNNKTALMVNHLIVLAGMVLIGVGTLLFHQGVLSPTIWMIAIGLGLYMGYVPFNSIFFDRMLAAFKYTGTVGFIMYVADAFGYLGSVAVLFYKEFGTKEVSWLDFFISSGYILSIVGTVLIAGSLIYFHRKHRNWNFNHSKEIQ